MQYNIATKKSITISEITSKLQYCYLPILTKTAENCFKAICRQKSQKLPQKHKIISMIKLSKIASKIQYNISQKSKQKYNLISIEKPSKIKPHVANA